MGRPHWVSQSRRRLWGGAEDALWFRLILSGRSETLPFSALVGGSWWGHHRGRVYSREVTASLGFPLLTYDNTNVEKVGGRDGAIARQLRVLAPQSQGPKFGPQHRHNLGVWWIPITSALREAETESPLGLAGSVLPWSDGGSGGTKGWD